MHRQDNARTLAPSAQAHLRRLAVKAVRAGLRQTEAAKTYGVSLRVVNKWVATDKVGGLRALKPKRRGRRLGQGGRLRVAQAQRIRSLIVGKMPDQLKLPFYLWTCAAVASLIAREYGIAVSLVGEALLLLWIGWSRFGLATNDRALYTFSFLTLLYFAVFSIVSARERRWFWATVPSKTLVAALALNVLAGTVLTLVGLPSLMPLAWWQTLAIFGYAMVACLGVNDAVKVAMIRWRVPAAVA